MEREPPRATPSRPGAAANSAAARAALLSPRYDVAPRPPPGSRDGSGGGGLLPALTPAAQVAPPSGARGASPSSFKRTGWTTPRAPPDPDASGGIFPEIEPPQRQRSRPLLDDASATDSDPDWDVFYPAKPAPRRHDALEKARSHAPVEAAPTQDVERNQLAYMEEMYNTISSLSEELEKERADRARLEERTAISRLVDESEYAPLGALSVLTPSMTELEEAAYGFSPMSPSSTITPRRMKLTPSPPQPHQPKRPGGSSNLTSQLAKDQVELCSALGKNAELRIRTREMERTAEKSTQELEQAQKQMKVAERRINNREEKLRGLLKEKMHWQKELKDMRDQVVEEKMRQVDIFRRMEVLKREHATRIEDMEATLRDADAENEELRAHVAELRAQHSYQAKRMEEMARLAKDEKDNFAVYIAETRQRFKEWKENETTALRTARDQALGNLKTEYDLKIARHQEEKQKLRDKVKDLEVSLKLMQKDRSLSPLELRLRKATILGSRDTSVTSEAELIEAHARIRELETLLEHAQEYQKRQDNIIKVSEATISRLVQEREVTALENLSAHTLATKSPSLGGEDFMVSTLGIPYMSRSPRDIRKPSQSPRIPSPPRPSRPNLPEPRSNHSNFAIDSSSERLTTQERKQLRISSLDVMAPVPVPPTTESAKEVAVVSDVVASPSEPANSKENLLLKELAQVREELEQVKRHLVQTNITAVETSSGFDAVRVVADDRPSQMSDVIVATNSNSDSTGRHHDIAAPFSEQSSPTDQQDDSNDRSTDSLSANIDGERVLDRTLSATENSVLSNEDDDGTNLRGAPSRDDQNATSKTERACAASPDDNPVPTESKFHVSADFTQVEVPLEALTKTNSTTEESICVVNESLNPLNDEIAMGELDLVLNNIDDVSTIEEHGSQILLSDDCPVDSIGKIESSEEMSGDVIYNVKDSLASIVKDTSGYDARDEDLIDSISRDDNSPCVEISHAATDEILELINSDNRVSTDNSKVEVNVMLHTITGNAAEEIRPPVSDGKVCFDCLTDEPSCTCMQEVASGKTDDPTIENQSPQALVSHLELYHTELLYNENSTSSITEKGFDDAVDIEHLDANSPEMSESIEVMAEIINKIDGTDSLEQLLEHFAATNESEVIAEPQPDCYDLSLPDNFSEVLLSAESAVVSLDTLNIIGLSNPIEETEILAVITQPYCEDSTKVMSEQSLPNDISEKGENPSYDDTEAPNRHLQENTDRFGETYPQVYQQDNPQLTEANNDMSANDAQISGEVSVESDNLVSIASAHETSSLYLNTHPLTPVQKGGTAIIAKSVSRSEIAWVAAAPSDWLLPSELSRREEVIEAVSVSDGEVSFTKVDELQGDKCTSALEESDSLVQIANVPAAECGIYLEISSAPMVVSIEKVASVQEVQGVDTEFEGETTDSNGSIVPEFNNDTSYIMIAAENLEHTTNVEQLSRALEFEHEADVRDVVESIVLSACLTRDPTKTAVGTEDTDVLDTQSESTYNELDGIVEECSPIVGDFHISVQIARADVQFQSVNLEIGEDASVNAQNDAEEKSSIYDPEKTDGTMLSPYEIPLDPVELAVTEFEMEIKESIAAIVEAAIVINSLDDPADNESEQDDDSLQLVDEETHLATMVAPSVQRNVSLAGISDILERESEHDLCGKVLEELDGSEDINAKTITIGRVDNEDTQITVDNPSTTPAQDQICNSTGVSDFNSSGNQVGAMPYKSNEDCIDPQANMAIIHKAAETYCDTLCSKAVEQIAYLHNNDNREYPTATSITKLEDASEGRKINLMDARVGKDFGPYSIKREEEIGRGITPVLFSREELKTAGVVAVALDFVTKLMKYALTCKESDCLEPAPEEMIDCRTSSTIFDDELSLRPSEEATATHDMYGGCDEIEIEFDVLVLVADMVQEILSLHDLIDASVQAAQAESVDNSATVAEETRIDNSRFDAHGSFCLTNESRIKECPPHSSIRYDAEKIECELSVAAMNLDCDCSSQLQNSQEQKRNVIMLVSKSLICNITQLVTTTIVERISQCKSAVDLVAGGAIVETLEMDQAIESSASTTGQWSIKRSNEAVAETKLSEPVDDIASSHTGKEHKETDQRHNSEDGVLFSSVEAVIQGLVQTLVSQNSTETQESVLDSIGVADLKPELSGVEFDDEYIPDHVSCSCESDGDESAHVISVLNDLCTETEAQVDYHESLHYDCECGTLTPVCLCSPEENCPLNVCNSIIVPYDADQCLEPLLKFQKPSTTKHVENDSCPRLEGVQLYTTHFTTELNGDVIDAMASMLVKLESENSSFEDKTDTSLENITLSVLSTPTNYVSDSCRPPNVDGEVREALFDLCTQVQQRSVAPVVKPVAFIPRRSSLSMTALPTLFERPNSTVEIGTTSPIEGRRASVRRKTKRSGSILATEQLLAWDLSPRVVDATESTVKKYATKRRVSRRGTNDPVRLLDPSDLKNPHLLAYDVSSEHGAQPFSLMDDSLLKIDPNARHIELEDEPEQVSEIIAKRKKLHYEAYCKFLAQRKTPAFNYAPVLIKFEWSDFVVATPAGPLAASSPVQKMRLLLKKGVRLPCGQYVIVAAFVRPLEDGNENLRVQIYDSERVEEFLFDFFDDHIKKYVVGWVGTDDQIRGFVAQLEFRREQSAVIIKLPEKKGILSPSDQRFLSDNSVDRMEEDGSRVRSSIIMEQPEGGLKLGEPRSPRSAPRRRTFLNQSPATLPSLQLGDQQKVSDDR